MLRALLSVMSAVALTACSDGMPGSDGGSPPRDAAVLDAAVLDAAVLDATIAIDSGSSDAGAFDAGADAASGCSSDLDCPCGEVCGEGGACVVSDCAEQVCPPDRTCTCVDGILDVDARTGPQWPEQDVVVRRRPLTAADDGTDLVLRGYRVHDATDQKGVHVTRCESTNGWRYRTVTLSCIEVHDVNRDEAGAAVGLHMDFIKIDGCMDDPSTDVLIEDTTVRTGNVYSLISDARIGTLTLRRVIHEADGALQIGTLSQPDDPDAGRIDHVIIESSPGLRVALLGTKIGEVRVVASPGLTGGEGSSTPVVYDAASCPARTLSANERCEP